MLLIVWQINCCNKTAQCLRILMTLINLSSSAEVAVRVLLGTEIQKHEIEALYINNFSLRVFCKWCTFSTLRMHNTLKNWKQTFAGFAPDFELTCGIVFMIVLSCVFSVTPYYLSISEQFFSLESSAVISGHGKSRLQLISPPFVLLLSSCL